MISTTTILPPRVDDYDKFLVLQNQGKQFRLKVNPTGIGLFDYIEEYIAEPMVVSESDTDKLKQQILDLQEVILNLQYKKLAGGV